jgi:hypothetical protein
MMKFLKLAGAAVALAALSTPAAASGQEKAAGAPTMRVLSDPAEIAAILAKCGIKRDAAGRPVIAPQAGQTNSVQTFRCDLSKEVQKQEKKPN